MEASVQQSDPVEQPADHSQTQTRANASLHAFDGEPWDDPVWLERHYSDQGLGLTTSEIADEVLADRQVTSETIRKRLHRFGLMDARSRGTADNTSVTRELLIEMTVEQFDEIVHEGKDVDVVLRRRSLTERTEQVTIDEFVPEAPDGPAEGTTTVTGRRVATDGGVPDLPDVEGWDRTHTRGGDVKYVAENRRATVVCVPVTTAGGDGYNCRLFASADRYVQGTPVTSEFAASEAEIPDVLSILAAQLPDAGAESEVGSA